ncbi:WG repeat-containing protein [Parvicella tangerina]|uniref:WG repeat-containing protein n=1 Tax=Parvicella tangerina TaxID=2829795 RepID=A0A916JRE3_9FLAO|nr:WG repeat-containing protein [Parvicella tangerina]CAG5085900.1 hypothetical protein CRYO30217_02926 [Parvicella tangerina]
MNSFLKYGALVLMLLVSLDGFTQPEPRQLEGKWGFVNDKGEWVVKAKYDEVKPFSEDLAAVRKKDKWGFIFESGKWAIKPRFSKVTSFSEGKAGVVWLKKSNGLWGFIDRQGLPIIAPAFSGVKKFKNNECEVKLPGMLPHQVIVINEKGKQLSPPHLKREKRNGYYHIISQKSNKQYIYCYVDKDGKLISPWSLDDYELGKKRQMIRVTAADDDSFNPDDILLSESEFYLFAYLNEQGEVASKWYREIRDYHLGYAVVRRDHRYCFIDAEYNEVTPLDFREVRRLNDDYCVAQISEESFVLLNYKGERIGKEFHGYDIFDEDHLIGYSMEEIGDDRQYKEALFDYDGNQKSGWYLKIYPKSSAYYRVLDDEYVETENGWEKKIFYNYIVDSTGEVLSHWRPTHEIKIEVDDFKLKDSIYHFLHQPKSPYYIEKTFFQSIFIYDLELDGDVLRFNGGDFYDGMALVSNLYSEDTIVKEVNGITFKIPDMRYGFMDWNGDLRLACKLEYTSSMTNGKAVYRKGDKYGVINYKGKVSLPPKYDLIGNFGNGLAPCYKDTAWCYIDFKGKEILPAKYDDVRPFKHGYAAVKVDKKWGLIDVRGREVLKMKYRKPPEALGRNKVKVLVDGVGYEIISL